MLEYHIEMNILHYSIGVFPERQGGLVRYSTDLAMEQSKNNDVFYLIPGKLGLFNKRLKICHDYDYNNLHIFRIVNALPIPIYSGVNNVDLYTKSVDQQTYEVFLKNNHIDVVHLHSLMGLHIELLRAAKRLNIPILYSTHDYYGLCLITTLYRYNCICDNVHFDENCAICSKNALSYFQLSMGQSVIYKKMKNNRLVSSLRHRTLDTNQKRKANTQPLESVDYNNLELYYRECYSLVNWFLFNSEQTKSVFEGRLGHLPGEVSHLLLPSICDKRKRRAFMKDGILRIGFMGESNEFKGYFLLKSSIDDLIRMGYNLELHVYNDNVDENNYIKRCGRYLSEDLDRIYDTLDIIVVPSLWLETYSFITVEAIFAGMPCIVSNRVGAKDLICNYSNGIVFDVSDKNALKSKLIEILNNSDILTTINMNLCNSNQSISFADHCIKICDSYQLVCNNACVDGELYGH